MESIPNHQPPTEAEIEEMKRQNDLKYLKDNPAKSPEKKDNVVKLETLNAYYSIVYSNHKVINSPEDIYGSDIILLELGGTTLENGERNVNRRIEEQRDFNQQYSEIIKYASEHSVPIYIPDTHKDVQYDAYLKTMVLPMIGTYVSYRLIKSSISDYVEKPVTRRSFLKNVGKAAAALYFSTPIMEATASALSRGEPNESSLERKSERQISAVNDAIHPELNSITMHGRNSLIAIKAEYIAKQIGNKLGRKPKISLVIGASHTGIEDTLKLSDQDRLKELRKYFNEKEIEDEKTMFHIEWDNKKPVVSSSQM